MKEINYISVVKKWQLILCAVVLMGIITCQPDKDKSSDDAGSSYPREVKPSLVITSKRNIITTRERIARGDSNYISIAEELRKRADLAMTKGPFSVTFHQSPAAGGNPHDYYSEGGYWWPDPRNPNGPYIRHDGQSNPNRYMHHEQDMSNLCNAVTVLSHAAYFLNENKYAMRAALLLRVWFVDEETRMNPRLQYAQAIPGRCEGRCIGIIDTACLIRLVNSLGILEESGMWPECERASIRKWFKQYLTWLVTSENGIQESRQPNNHATGWAAQVITFGAYVGNQAAVNQVCNQFRLTLIPNQMDDKGGFPWEEARTNSLSYSVRNLNLLAIICEVAHTQGIDLWHFRTPDGRGMRTALDYLLPYLKNPATWSKQQIIPYKPAHKLPYYLSSLRFENPKYAKIIGSQLQQAVLTDAGILELTHPSLDF